MPEIPAIKGELLNVVAMTREEQYTILVARVPERDHRSYRVRFAATFSTNPSVGSQNVEARASARSLEFPERLHRPAMGRYSIERAS
jgi:hypothetical protein